MNSKLVYSTDDSINLNDEVKKTIKIEPSDQHIRIHLDRRGGGKIVAIIRGYNGANKQLLNLCSTLKKKFSIGGTVKDGTILLQGNIRDNLIQYLINEGYNAKPSGG